MIKQFQIYSYSSQLVVLTNTTFNDVESLLDALLKKQSRALTSNPQIPCQSINWVRRLIPAKYRVQRSRPEMALETVELQRIVV